ncbi:MAG: enoyl-CoA hydratase/isomerase family protein, partial [Alphaproteobacteria bacterium]
MAETQFMQHVAIGEVHVLRLANPPVNTLRTEIRAGLYDGMKAARAAGAKAVVIIGTGRMFCAGAEMTEFGKPRVPPSLTEVFEQFESFPGLTVAAIHGSALGGGLEVALACHARVAVADANLGLPEVKRGFVPGAGGPQRQPRLIGPEAALTIIVPGDPVKATEALKLGFVDAIIDGDLEDGAIAVARANLVRNFTLARTRT